MVPKSGNSGQKDGGMVQNLGNRTKRGVRYKNQEIQETGQKNRGLVQKSGNWEQKSGSNTNIRKQDKGRGGRKHDWKGYEAKIVHR